MNSSPPINSTPRRDSSYISAFRAAGLGLTLIAFLAPAQAASTTKIAWLWDGASAPAQADVQAAVVMQHLLLNGPDILVRPRPRAPALMPGSPVTPVVHVEIGALRSPVDAERQRRAIVQAVLQVAPLSTSGWVQLDMETRASQRDFYQTAVRDLRRALPPQIKLSVTALAWWCRDPTWLDGLPADEIVPMFFRMGRDTAALRRVFSFEPQRLDPRCRSDVAGFSIQEPFDHETTARYRKTYWFDDHRWRQSRVP